MTFSTGLVLAYYPDTSHPMESTYGRPSSGKPRSTPASKKAFTY